MGGAGEWVELGVGGAGWEPFLSLSSPALVKNQMIKHAGEKRI